MKRHVLFAGIIVLALLCGGASVWEGNAVVGGAGDFSSEGLFGACNSFPRDTSVEVSNLENGRTITVVISRNVDNPGVFIALSPKAAEALGMKVGSAARVRAISKTVSNAQASLPATRPGENADPDFNPRALVERGKTTAAGAAVPLPPAAAAAPSAAAIIDAAVNEAGNQAAAGSEPASPAGASEPGEAAQAGVPTTAPAAESGAGAKVAADEAPLPPEASALAGVPRPAPFALSLPTPDQVQPGPEGQSPSARAFPATGPEELGGAILQPRKTGPGRVALAEPDVSAPVAEEPAVAEGLDRPELAQVGNHIELLEPGLGPDTLPEDALPRIAVPAPGAPKPELAEIDVGTKPAEATAEAIDIEKPAVAALPGAPVPLSEPPAEGLVETPEATGLEHPAQVEPATGMALAEPSPASPELLHAPAPGAAAAGSPGELSIALEPAAPRPPAGSASAPAASPASPGAKVATKPALKAGAVTPKAVTLVPALSKGSFYVQVGVYGTNEAIEKAAGGFASGYPLAMERVEMKTGSAYRLYVGPLSRDESGVVLYRIKSLGYKDAFVRIGT